VDTADSSRQPGAVDQDLLRLGDLYLKAVQLELLDADRREGAQEDQRDGYLGPCLGAIGAGWDACLHSARAIRR
jgi:hypothetical protein